jgi:hypothetical protein
MNEPKDDLRNLKQKVEECAKKIVYEQSAERNGKLGHQVLQTGIFKPDKINHEINQKVQKKIPLLNHEKKIAGRPSIGSISSGGQALEYAVQKFAATRYVAKNYANVLNDIGHCITGTAIKEASRPLKKSRVETVQLQKDDDCTKALAYTPANEKGKLG